MSRPPQRLPQPQRRPACRARLSRLTIVSAAAPRQHAAEHPASLCEHCRRCRPARLLRPTRRARRAKRCPRHHTGRRRGRSARCSLAPRCGARRRPGRTPPKETFGLYEAEHPKPPPAAPSLEARVVALGKSANGHMTVSLEGGAVWELDDSDPLLAVGETCDHHARDVRLLPHAHPEPSVRTARAGCPEGPKKTAGSAARRF